MPCGWVSPKRRPKKDPYLVCVAGAATVIYYACDYWWSDLEVNLRGRAVEESRTFDPE